MPDLMATEPILLFLLSPSHCGRLALLAGLFCGTVHAVDANRFMPFDEAPFGPYRAQVCDKFFDHDERIHFLAQSLVAPPG